MRFPTELETFCQHFRRGHAVLAFNIAVAAAGGESPAPQRCVVRSVFAKRNFRKSIFTFDGGVPFAEFRRGRLKVNSAARVGRRTLRARPYPYHL
ncbi:hypothetical protein GWI33_015691 [Rhynchophorus ferrugineus]|uniref:Uncharacterized protein n=1 Tax=Rhynchophorus ferrugineus TaxID=354439 RepID=A0A834I0B3_RHYFE|nr:hypothetical protein GWI33_015691 [Rhynchophorus ferrugineus]